MIQTFKPVTSKIKTRIRPFAHNCWIPKVFQSKPKKIDFLKILHRCYPLTRSFRTIRRVAAGDIAVIRIRAYTAAVPKLRVPKDRKARLRRTIARIKKHRTYIRIGLSLGDIRQLLLYLYVYRKVLSNWPSTVVAERCVCTHEQPEDTMEPSDFAE